MSGERTSIVEHVAVQLCKVQRLRAFTCQEDSDAKGLLIRKTGRFLYRATPLGFGYLHEGEVEFMRNPPPSCPRGPWRVVCNGIQFRSCMFMTPVVDALLDEKETNDTSPTKYLARRLKRQKCLQVELSDDEVTLGWIKKTTDFGFGVFTPITKLTFNRSSGLLMKESIHLKGWRTEVVYKYDFVV